MDDCQSDVDIQGMRGLQGMDIQETFSFSDEDFAENAKHMTPDTLWGLERSTLQSKMLAGTGIGISSLLLLPTLGISTLGLAYSSRAVNIARRKLEIAQAELERRNLPAWHKTKRDYAIPLALTFTVAPFTSILDKFGVPATEGAEQYAEKHLTERENPQGRLRKDGDGIENIEKIKHGKRIPLNSTARFIFLSKGGHPISQPFITGNCGHTPTTRECRFCGISIDPNSDTDSFYHCCECSYERSCDICEVCVAGRGCSCVFAEEHTLCRQGKLHSRVDYGDLK